MSFIGIRVPHETARLLHEIDVPGEKEDSAQLHITLLYLGKNVPIKDFAKAMVATYEVTEKTCPFWVKSTSVACFPVDYGNPYPIIAPVQSPQLFQLHKYLKRSFDKSGIEYNKQFKLYRPHITLSFNDVAIKKTKIEPIEWPIQELVLWGGEDGDNRVFTTFPLEIKKNGELECEEIVK